LSRDGGRGLAGDQRDLGMLGAIVFTYGMLTSFVLSGAARNRKLQRPNPPMLVHAGHVCFGFSIGMSVLMTLLAIRTLLG